MEEPVICLFALEFITQEQVPRFERKALLDFTKLEAAIEVDRESS